MRTNDSEAQGPDTREVTTLLENQRDIFDDMVSYYLSIKLEESHRDKKSVVSTTKETAVDGDYMQKNSKSDSGYIVQKSSLQRHT